MTITDGLLAVLERSRRLGFLGPGSLRVQVEHARGFAAGPEQTGPAAPPARFVDLGSGGGVPGLVLATLWPASRGVLLDASARRCEFLAEAVDELGFAGRIDVVRARAEEAGREPALRATCDLVVARSFGPPAVTAECAAPLLAKEGRLTVSEPPETPPDPPRWPPAGLAQLGLVPGPEWQVPFHYRSFVQVEPCPDRYPRRVGVPAKRPLF
jgi:16S rRNA (guanine527-N7)-methyltransferase